MGQQKAHQKTMLIILDGWGLGTDPAISAIAQARTPVFDALCKNYPNTTLEACGEAVGLPPGQMGNSEVGHLNLGAGRVVYQELARINKAIETGEFQKNQVLKHFLERCQKGKGRLHIMGLYSTGGVHSHAAHAHVLIEEAEKIGLEHIYLHAFMDGRDCDPHSGLRHIQELQEFLSGRRTRLATMVGRYYAMDRDHRWARVKKAYDLLVHGRGQKVKDPVHALDASYKEGISDEFLEPHYLGSEDLECTIKPGDSVIFFNFRTDRGRQLTSVLTQHSQPEFGLHTLDLNFATLTQYDPTFRQIQVFYEKEDPQNTLGEVLAKSGIRQLRIAETEKYPHVTYFFSGGREEPFPGEERLLIPSPKVATYDLKPEMSAQELTDALLPRIASEEFHFICLNFANPDMVGHTGNFNAVVRACQTVDTCLGRVLETAAQHGYTSIILADHGNADYMINPDGSVNTAHSLNKVPCILHNYPHRAQMHHGVLGDVAPTLLEIMGMNPPREMTGRSLLKKIALWLCPFLFALASCTGDPEDRKPSGYPGLPQLVQQSLKKELFLEAQDPKSLVLLRRAERNGQRAYTQISKPDLPKELGLFRELDLSLPAYAGAYDSVFWSIGEHQCALYFPVEQATHTDIQYLFLMYRGQELVLAQSRKKISNMLYQSSLTATYVPGKGYRLRGMQQPVWLRSQHFQVHGFFVQPGLLIH